MRMKTVAGVPILQHVTHYGAPVPATFTAFRDRAEFCDVVVVLPDGRERHLHAVLLADKSEFFRAALTAPFAEARQRRVVLDPAMDPEAWPALEEYFYTDQIQLDDDNVLPLTTLSRQLLVGAVSEFCRDYLSRRLDSQNCMAYLRMALACQLEWLLPMCIAAAARGFQLVCKADTSGLPAESVLAILQHPEVCVYQEQEVVDFLQRYLASTHAPAAAVHALCSQIRFAYLDTSSLLALAEQGFVPQDVLLAGSLVRLVYLEPHCTCAESTPRGPPPRDSYAGPHASHLVKGSLQAAIMAFYNSPAVAAIRSGVHLDEVMAAVRGQGHGGATQETTRRALEQLCNDDQLYNTTDEHTWTRTIF